MFDFAPQMQQMMQAPQWGPHGAGQGMLFGPGEGPGSSESSPGGGSPPTAPHQIGLDAEGILQMIASEKKLPPTVQALVNMFLQSKTRASEQSQFAEMGASLDPSQAPNYVQQAEQQQDGPVFPGEWQR